MRKGIVLATILIVLLDCVAASNFAGIYSGFGVELIGTTTPGVISTLSITILQNGNVTTTFSAPSPNSVYGTFDGSQLQMPIDTKGCMFKGSIIQVPSFNGTDNNGKNFWFAVCSSGPCLSNGLNFVGSYSITYLDHHGNQGSGTMTIAPNNTVTFEISMNSSGVSTGGSGNYVGTLERSKISAVGTVVDIGGKTQTNDVITGTGNNAPSFSGDLICAGMGLNAVTWFATCSGGPCLSSIVCTPNWNCTGFNNCSLAGVQTQTCTDLNNCSNSSGEPLESQACVPIPIICTPNWNCTDFGDCSANGTQVRICTDMNNCNTTSNEPIESQICVPTPVACFPDWSCTVFSNCTRNGTQVRICTDVNKCNNTASKPTENQNCTPPSNNVLLYIIIVLIVIASVLIYLIVKRKPTQPAQLTPAPPTQPSAESVPSQQTPPPSPERPQSLPAAPQAPDKPV